MLITAAPIVIPVNTANVPTEAVAAEAAQRPKIPQPPSASEGSRSKNSTDFNEQPKSSQLLDASVDQNQTVEEKGSSEQQQNGQPSNQSSNQSNGDEQLEAEEAEEAAQIQKLRNRDREVRAHEQAHASVGGVLAGAPNLNFTTGPDGKRYAVSGDVSIDISKVPNDPEATIRKLEQVQRAALAPANPSSQDVRVASQASASENQARAELNVKRLQEAQEQKVTDSERVSGNSEQESGSDSQEFASIRESSNVNLSSEQINLRASVKPGIVNLSSTDSGLAAETSNSNQLNLNPVQARRQAAQLNQRIVGSGALDVNENPSRSFRV